MSSNRTISKSALSVRNFAVKISEGSTSQQSSSLDIVTLITVTILTMIGLIMVYSVTLHAGFAYLNGQILRMCVGLCAMVIASIVPYKYYRGRVKDVLLIGTIILLILTLTIGRKVAVARRWALFFQPAEIAKYTVIIWLCGYFANLREKQSSSVTKLKKLNNFPFLPLFVVGIIVMLLLLQPAVGTSAILALSTLLIFYISGVKLKYLFLIAAIGITIFSLSIVTIPYAKKRFNEFRNGTTYQQMQSKIAIGSGGVLGKGLGEGKQKFNFLPKLHTDFIFSAIGEEFGLIGSCVVLILFFILLSRGLKVGIESNNDFGLLLASGITILVFEYFLVHLGVALSILPTTGQPLPFISYGGSALVTNLYAIGIILNISKFRRNKIDKNSNYNRWHRRAYFPRSRSW